MASWHGHRDDGDIPEPVQEVWRAKFRPGAGGGTNVDVCVLDDAGKVVRAFGAIPAQGRGPGKGDFRGDAVVNHWKTEVAAARATLGLGEAGEPRAVTLPAGADGSLRVFTRLDDPGMPAYNAPVVEVVENIDWEAFARPAKPVTVDASICLPWLSKMFPGGVMERTDPETKRVYDVTGAEGDLTFEPAGAKGESKFAFLHGVVTMTDSGGGGFSWKGELRVVLEYRGDGPPTLRGIFEGIYPRKGPNGDREFPITGVFESLKR